jgi:hypothetical protein
MDCTIKDYSQERILTLEGSQALIMSGNHEVWQVARKAGYFPKPFTYLEYVRCIDIILQKITGTNHAPFKHIIYNRAIQTVIKPCREHNKFHFQMFIENNTAEIM